MLGSGGPTHRKIRKPLGILDSDAVAATTIQERNLVEAGALRKMLNPRSLEGPDGEAVATQLTKKGYFHQTVITITLIFSR